MDFFTFLKVEILDFDFNILKEHQILIYMKSFGHLIGVKTLSNCKLWILQRYFKL